MDIQLGLMTTNVGYFMEGFAIRVDTAYHISWQTLKRFWKPFFFVFRHHSSFDRSSTSRDVPLQGI